ncbi:MAG: ABC transporter permease, partial [Atopobium sp.]|nr:ABC transporter permease [Atopobium sp.]
LYGGQTVQQTVGAPSEIINIVIGTIVFFMALGGVIPMLADRLDHKRAQKAKEEEAKLAAQVSDASDPSQEEANNAH